MSQRGFFLDREQAATVHAATLQVLETTGISLDHPEVEDQLRTRGATVDADGRLLIPRALVEEALEAAPRGFTLFDREGDLAFEVESGASLFGPGSDALYQLDRGTGEPRDARLADVASNARLAESLGFDFIMSMALPRDLGAQRLYPAVFAEMIRSSRKPIVATMVNVEDLRRILEIAALVRGDETSLAERPCFAAYLEPMSPLRFDRASVDKLVYCARKRIPFIFAAGANLGAAAPISPEGGVVQGSAESLAGLVIASLQDEAPCFIYGANTSSADMRSALVAYGAPEWSRTVAMYADMGRFYGLPSWGMAGCTDARRLDAQAAWEACRGILLALQCGSTVVHDMGYMALGELFDPRFLVLCAEILREARHMLSPADLSPQALSTAVIDEVARGDGLYLTHKDTAKRFRDTLFISSLVDRRKVGDASEPMEERLADRVEALLSSTPAVGLDQEKSAAVAAYVDAIPAD